MFCVCGGGVVDGLFDSMDMDPRVRFVDLFGVSSAANLAAIFFSSSFWANDLTEVTPVGVAEGVAIADAVVFGVEVTDADEGGKWLVVAVGWDVLGVLASDLEDDVDDCEEGRDWVALVDMAVGCGVAVLAA